MEKWLVPGPGRENTDDLGTSCSARSKGVLTKEWGMLKDHRTQSEGDPNSQSCNNVMWEERKRERSKETKKKLDFSP